MSDPNDYRINITKSILDKYDFPDLHHLHQSNMINNYFVNVIPYPWISCWFS